MRAIMETKILYKFEELSEKAKEYVRQEYLNHLEPSDFEESILDDLRNIFNQSDLNIEFSLGYSQGDGLNIYGKLNIQDVLTNIQMETNIMVPEFKKYAKFMSEEDVKIIEEYAKECPEITIPQNKRGYNFCIANQIDAENEILDALEQAEYKNINNNAVKKFNNLLRMLFTDFAAEYEAQGYKYFYEVDDNLLKDIYDDEGSEFTEDGKLYEICSNEKAKKHEPCNMTK